MSKGGGALNKILDDEFLLSLAKSSDLYKIGSNSVLDPEEIRIGLKVVPRAVMSLLISELSSMELNAHKDIELPFGKEAKIRVSKNAADDYTGSVYSDNKLVYDFKNRSIPGLGIILLSTFELYDLENLSPVKSEDPKLPPPSEDMDRRIQQMIDQRMELHSLVSKVVHSKMDERDAIHKMMMDKLSEAMKPHVPPMPISEPARSVGPLNIEAKDVMKKEAPVRKGSPLKEFIERKKKPKEYHVEISKSEQVDCGDCGQIIFGSGQISSCLCYGENMGSKLWIKKSEDGIQIRFSKNWSVENIEMLLETLRAKK